jgi:hypothetical protein
VVEAFDRRSETFEVFRVAAGGDGRQRAPVEGAAESDDAPALRVAGDEMIAPRRLDGGFARLGAGIAEEYLVGERRADEPLRQPLLPLDAIEVGRVPELAGLLGQCRDEARVGVPQNVDRDAGSEIEIPVARGRDQPRALAPLEDEVLAPVRAHDSR